MPPGGKKHPDSFGRGTPQGTGGLCHRAGPEADRRFGFTRLPVNPERGAGVIPARQSSGCSIRSLRRGPSSKLTCRESAASRALKRPIQLTSFSSVQYRADRNEGL